MSERFHVITGGPGSGKSSLVSALRASGIRSMPEAGRAIIQEQLAIGGTALPWADRQAFAALMLSWDLRSYRKALEMHEPIVFDRGIPDIVGYLRLSGLPVPACVMQAARTRRYARHVFIAPHWPAIFVQDTERKQSAAEAEATYHAMAEVYTSLGYELVSLPLASIPDRERYIRAHIG